MRAFFEAVTPEPGASWTFLNRPLRDGIPFEWHHHPEYELTLTLNSRGFRYIGDDVDVYGDGDLVLVGPGIPHSWHSREAVDAQQPHTALVIWFTQEWLSGLAAAMPELAQTAGFIQRGAQGLRFGQEASAAAAPSILAMRTAAPPERLLLLLKVLVELSHDGQAVALSNIPHAAQQQSAMEPRIVRALNYLHGHFAEPVSASSMAEIACISVSGFHRMFRRHTRMTLVGYLTRLRIGRACSLLIATSQSIANIAGEVGYTNLSLFNRQFAALKNEAPSAFRKRHQAALAAR